MDIASILLIATGFGLGLVHSVDPDHIVAVSTLLCNTNNLRKSVLSATAWGAGHSAMLLLVGVLFLFLRVELPTYLIEIFEFTAALMLIVLGAIVVKSIFAKANKNEVGNGNGAHKHIGNDGKIIIHSHSHDSKHVHKSIFTGVIQGLAGSAALMLVTLTTISSLGIGLVFILVFGAGVILGMVCVSCLIGSLLKFTSSRLEKVHEKIKLITGLISIIFGIYLVTQVALTHFL